MNAPRIVCVGGGHGLSTALRAARALSADVTAIVTAADDGGSSGALRAQLGIPAPGDIRMAIAALAPDKAREGLLQYRFREGELAGHPLGNLLIAAMTDLRGNFADAIAEVAILAGIVGRVLPSAIEPLTLHAVIAGVEVAGQVAIAQGPAAVERLWLAPNVDGYEGALDALETADLVVLSPGSLFTSLIAALLPMGIPEAAARAQRVAYVLNLSEQVGETLGLDAAGHLHALASHCPALRIDAVLVHDGDLDGIPRPIAVDDQALRAPLIRADLRGVGPVHAPEKLAEVLRGLL